MSSDTTQGTRLHRSFSSTLPRNHLFFLPILSPGFLLGSFVPSLSVLCVPPSYVTPSELRYRYHDAKYRPRKFESRMWPIPSFSLSLFLASFAAFLFSSLSATNRCSSFSFFTSWARVVEGVEEVRPYGPGLPGFVPTLVHVYGVSRIEKCERAHRCFF